jgi:hypothetical protein
MELLNQQLQSLVGQYGMRVVLDALARVAEQHAKEGKPMPFDGETAVDPCDCETLAQNLRSSMF